eukprot:8846766-Pyramimonas_sp.AAC.1
MDRSRGSRLFHVYSPQLVGESGELDTGREKGKGHWGVECALAVIGTGGPAKRSDVIARATRGGAGASGPHPRRRRHGCP